MKLHMIADVHDCKTVEEARVKLDAFREAVLPSENHGITLYEDAQRKCLVDALTLAEPCVEDLRRLTGFGETCVQCRIALKAIAKAKGT